MHNGSLRELLISNWVETQLFDPSDETVMALYTLALKMVANTFSIEALAFGQAMKSKE